jgi:hypothetical protein
MATPVRFTDASCCEEWIFDAVSGLIISHDDCDAIAAKLHSALFDDALLVRAAILNAETVQSAAPRPHPKGTAIGLYDRIFKALSTAE